MVLATSRVVVVVHQGDVPSIASSSVGRPWECVVSGWSSRHTGSVAIRIVSLVPSATETLFALGLGAQVAAVTHECDFPPDARNLPKVTCDVIGPGLAPDAIDRAVKELTEQGRSIYQLDGVGLRDLKPDLIVTQALCSVCAVSADDVRAIAAEMDPVPEIVSLDPHTLGEVLGDVRTLAQATGSRDAGVDLVQDAAARIDRVRAAVKNAPRRRVAMLEWLDPIFVGGHWVPQLIEYAGGVDLLGLAGEPSEQRSWEEVAAVAPEVVIVAPCGYEVDRALAEARAYEDRLRALGARTIAIADACAWFSRPGPRLVEGLEWLGHVLHPGLVPEPPGGVVRL
jgi:iron complex transport system substrate-binding protein